MAKKLSIIIVATTLIGLLFYYNNYVPFTPKLLDVAKNQYKVIEVDDQFYINLDKVLTFYSIDHKFSGRKIYIKRIKAVNDEFLLNYTEKAFDKDWMR